MSGPKYSDYVLERQRLLQIQAQLEAELERSKCNQITEQINECLERSDLYFSQIDIAKFEKNITTAEGEFIGANIGEAVAWFKDPNNTSVVNSYYNKLKNI